MLIFFNLFTCIIYNMLSNIKQLITRNIIKIKDNNKMKVIKITDNLKPSLNLIRLDMIKKWEVIT